MRIILTLLILFFTTPIALGAVDNYTITVSPSVVEFQVIDPSGNVTGYDPNTKTILGNIPNTIYLRLTAPGPINVSPTKDEIYHRFGEAEYPLPVPLTTGLYKIKLFGTIMPESIVLWVELRDHVISFAEAEKNV